MDRLIGNEAMAGVETPEFNKKLHVSLEKLTRRARTLGVEMNGIVQCDDAAEDFYPDTRLFGASLAKVPLTHIILDHFYAGDTFAIDRGQVATSGGGRHDVIRSARQATAAE